MIMYYVAGDVASKGIQRVNVEPIPQTSNAVFFKSAQQYTNLDYVEPTGKRWSRRTPTLFETKILYSYNLYPTMADAVIAAKAAVSEMMQESQEYINKYERKLNWHKARIERLSKVKF